MSGGYNSEEEYQEVLDELDWEPRENPDSAFVEGSFNENLSWWLERQNEDLEDGKDLVYCFILTPTNLEDGKSQEVLEELEGLMENLDDTDPVVRHKNSHYTVKGSISQDNLMPIRRARYEFEQYLGI
jgi:hypothetical protein